MMINKLKLLSTAIFCLVLALWSEAKCAAPAPDPIKGHFTNINSDNWVEYGHPHQPLPFNQFDGDAILQGNLKEIDIPVDGNYSLSAVYAWRAIRDGLAQNPYPAQTSLRIHGNCVQASRSHLNLRANETDYGSVNYTGFFKAGEKVCVAISGSDNAQYLPGRFEFFIEKLG